MKSKIIFCVGFLLLHSSSANVYQPRLDLEFEIQAIYKGQISQIGIRGNGLGLNFETTSEMKQISDQVWSYKIKFETDEFGYRCNGCPDQSESFIPHGEKLKLKFYALHNGIEHPSLGSTFDVFLPMSKVSTYFPTPVRTFHPYFFTKKGVVFSLDINSNDPILGSRNLPVYVPPGVLENPQIVYDRLFIVDMSTERALSLKSLLDETFVNGVASDTIIIGFGDWKPDAIYQDEGTDRTNLLTPTVGENAICKEGSFDDGCNGCLPEDMTQEEYFYLMTEGGCGITIQLGGSADASLDFLLGIVQYEVNTYLMMNYGILTTSDKSGSFVLGFSHGGLFACYAGWTRPWAFRGVGCQSPSFWWPTLIGNGTFVNDFYLPNLILETDLGDQPNVDILIDVGGDEEDDFYQMVSEAELVYEILGDHGPFMKDVNLWLNVYPGQGHTTDSWIGRLYNPLAVLLRDRDRD